MKPYQLLLPAFAITEITLLKPHRYLKEANPTAQTKSHLVRRLENSTFISPPPPKLTNHSAHGIDTIGNSTACLAATREFEKACRYPMGDLDYSLGYRQCHKAKALYERYCNIEHRKNPFTESDPVRRDTSLILLSVAFFLALAKNAAACSDYLDSDGTNDNTFVSNHRLHHLIDKWVERATEIELGITQDPDQIIAMKAQIEQLEPTEKKLLKQLLDQFELAYSGSHHRPPHNDVQTALSAEKHLKLCSMLIMKEYPVSDAHKAIEKSVKHLINLRTHRRKSPEQKMAELHNSLQRLLFLVDIKEDALSYSNAGIDPNDCCPITLSYLVEDNTIQITDPVHVDRFNSNGERIKPMLYSLDALAAYYIEHGYDPTFRTEVKPSGIKKIPEQVVLDFYGLNQKDNIELPQLNNRVSMNCMESLTPSF